MNTFFRFSTISALLSLVFSLEISAQTVKADELIIANGGIFEFSAPYKDFVTMQSTDIKTTISTVFDTIYTQSVQDLAISSDGKYVFVTAEDSLVKYDLTTYKRIAAIQLDGLNHLAIYGNYLVVGRQYPATNNFVQVLNAVDLSLAYIVNEVSDETSGITILKDTAYVGVPGGWMSITGKIAKIDLANKHFISEINYGGNGQGMTGLVNDGTSVYVANTLGWGSSTGVIASLNTKTGDTNTTVVKMPFGNGANLAAFAINKDTLFSIFNGKIGSYNINNKNIIDTVLINQPEGIAAATYDDVDGEFYLTFSDFASYGFGKIFTSRGTKLADFATGISPQAIGYRTKGMINAILETKPAVSFTVYPNPTSSYINLNYNLNDQLVSISIVDMSGKIVFNTIEGLAVSPYQVDLSGLSSGMYLVNAVFKNSTSSKLIVKE